MSTPMIKAKKRKIDGEFRVFKSSWTLDFECLLCLICQEKIGVLKEYNM